MAEVAITLKLSASEFQTLRGELTDHRDWLRDLAKRSATASAKQSLVKREAQVTFILEKLG